MTHRSHTPLRLTVALALPLAGALALAGCGSTPPPEVIAGDGVLCDITQRLAADDLRVRCLLQPGDDPHQFRLTPQQSRDLSQAQLVLINGYGLTPSLAEQSKAVAVAERAVPGSPELKALQDSHGDHQEEGHAAGHAHADLHDHGDRDPHVWHDPGQASAMVQLVAQQLEQLKPAARPRIAARARAMTTVLGQLDRWNRQQLATIPVARPLASGHRAFASLARAYGLEELPLVDSMSSSDNLRPQAFQAVVQQLKQEQVPMLFNEQLPPSKALQRISALSGVPLTAEPLVADGLAPAGDGSASSLVATLSANTCLIVNGLQGRCDRASQQALIQSWQAIR
ncbi:MAG: metal ABC transporter substrate-binding protein [Cyanobium sp. D14.bin.5]|nr:metal ABC transporter substrate-binding protein [Cyanobium sp. D14.bin.5]